MNNNRTKPQLKGNSKNNKNVLHELAYFIQIKNTSLFTKYQ